MAVDFCKEHDDVTLWNDLIDHSLDKPIFVNVLLHNIGTHVDPRILIQKIESGQEIPGLRDSLVQIIHDYRLQLTIQQGAQKILVADCVNLIERQYSTHNRALGVDHSDICSGCNGAIISGGPNGTTAAPIQDAKIFHCRHFFHIDCLGSDTDSCSLCQHKN